MKNNKIENIINSIKSKKQVEDNISYQDMYLFRHVMSMVREYEPDMACSGVFIKDGSGRDKVMVNAALWHKSMESCKLYEFVIVPTEEYEQFEGREDDNCEKIMRHFVSNEKSFVGSIGGKTIVPAGILMYDIYDKTKYDGDAPAGAKIEILYTNRNLRGQGVATRLKTHFNQVLKSRGVESFFGYSSALDLIDGKDRNNSNEVLKKIYGRMGIHMVPENRHGLFLGYPKEFEDIDLPIQYLDPADFTKQSKDVKAKSIFRRKSKSNTTDMSTVKPIAVVEEMSK